MSATVPIAKPARPGAARPAGVKTPGGAGLTQQASRQAKLVAAAVLEVLAGQRTPAQAAAALAVSLPRYYQLEGRALRGLLGACEPRPGGPRRDAERELVGLRQERARLERELARQQALVRLAQRAVGLPAPPAKPAQAPGKRRRRPTARAAPVVARLRKEVEAEGPAAAPAAEGAAR
jgi:hypothetical protein